jgi:glycogen operon protein
MESASRLADLLRQRQIQWHGVKPLQPGWGEDSHNFPFTRMGFQGCEQHLILLNAYWEALQFELPSPLPGSAGWLRFIDTSLESPFDVNEATRAPLIESNGRYSFRPRSTADQYNRLIRMAFFFLASGAPVDAHQPIRS